MTLFYVCLNLSFCGCFVTEKKPKQNNPYPHKWIVLPSREGFLANQSHESKYVNIINILLQKQHTETRMCMWEYSGTIVHGDSKSFPLCLFMCVCVSSVLSQVKVFKHSSVHVLAQPWASRTYCMNRWPWFEIQVHICWICTCPNTRLCVLSIHTYLYGYIHI